MVSTILCNLSDVQDIISEEKIIWVSEVLAALGVPDDFFDLDIDEYREKMEEIGVEIITTSSGEVRIYKKAWNQDKAEEKCGWLPAEKEHLVAQWSDPERVIRVDGKEAYYEIRLKEWSILKMRKK